MILPAAVYIAWDIFFTATGVWSFNEACIVGIRIVNLPLEEVLFFFVVPYCCVFIYECILAYFPTVRDMRNGDAWLKCLAVVLLAAGLFYYKRYYTGWTFIFTGGFIMLLYLLRRFFASFKATAFLLSYLIILIPFLVVNGFLTAIPVVLYNDAENLGIRIYSIPFEDVFYGMLLILMNIVLYEKLKANGR